MLHPFSELVTSARLAQAESRRCEVEPISAADTQVFGDAVEERALCFLAKCCANRFWYWVVVEQAARHAIGNRIQLAHVVNAIHSVRRQNQDNLLDCAIGNLDRDRLARAIAHGTVLLGANAKYVTNPLFHSDFDPVRAATAACGSR